MPNRIDYDAILRKIPGTEKYEFALRWELNQKKDDAEIPFMHGPDDFFCIKIQLGKSLDKSKRQNLKKDGTWGNIGDCHKIKVKPKKFAMIEPPQKEVKADYYYDYLPDGGKNIKWRKGHKPQEQITGIEATDTEEIIKKKIQEKGFGVSHLLLGIERDKIVEKGRDFFYKKIDNNTHIIQHLNGEKKDNYTIKETALSLAEALFECQDGCFETMANTIAKIEEIKPLLANAPLRLNSGSTFRDQAINEINTSLVKAAEPFHQIKGLECDNVVKSFKTTYVLSELFRFNEEELAQLNKIYVETRNATGSIGTKFLTGGKLIDYWHLYSGSQNASGMGKQFYAADLLGLGLHIGSFTRRDVEVWLKNKEKVWVEIEYVKHSSNQDDDDKDCCNEEFDNRDDRVRSSQSLPCLDSLHFERALSHDENFSSCNVLTPAKASINYDLLNLLPKKDKSQEDYELTSFSYENTTSEQFVTIKIDIDKKEYDPEGINGRPFSGFNIYGVWEPEKDDVHYPELKKYFDDEGFNPKLSDLKPWLITRFYSYELDLKDAIGKGPASANLNHALNNPPYKALIPNCVGSDNIQNTLKDADELLKDQTEEPSISHLFVDDNKDVLSNIYSLDLRKGLLFGNKSDEEKTLKGWDPLMPVYPDWTPEMNRRRDPVEKSPQKYRFWVTTVDWFDQESEPVPVMSDISSIFQPKFRVPLSSPVLQSRDVRTVENGKRDLVKDSLVYNEQNNSLKLEWETPFINRGNEFADAEEGNRPDNLVKRLDKSKLKAHVMVFRKVLKRKIDANGLMSTLRYAEIGEEYPYNTPNWTNAKNDIVLTEDGTPSGWEKFRTIEVDYTAAKNDAWHLELNDLNPNDRGFEYTALVGFTVNEKWEPFWSENRDKQLIRYFKKNKDGSISAEKGCVPEYPRVSSVERTNTCFAVNQESAKGVSTNSLASTWLEATHIKSATKIDRDLVSFKLLNSKVISENGDEIVHKNWKGTDIDLTEGQKIMLESALNRCNIPDSYGDERLKNVYEILASDFATTGKDKESEFENYVQYSVIGFRGLINLSWSYQSIRTQPKETRAEAVTQKVYQGTVPIIRNFDSQDEEQRFLRQSHTVVMDGLRRLDYDPTDGLATYSVRLDKDHSVYKTVNNLAKVKNPVVVTLTNFTNGRYIGDLKGLEVNGNELKLKFSFKENFYRAMEPPKSAAVGMSLCEEILELETDLEPEKSDYELVLPVKGGNNEVFLWSVVTNSAQEIASDFGDIVSIVREFKTTVMPKEPELNAILPPHTDEFYGTQELLEKWAPNLIDSPRDAPRVVVSWKDNAIPDDVYVIIERRRKKAFDDEGLSPFMNQDFSVYEALEKIQFEKGDLKYDDVRKLAQWLLGFRIPVPNDIEDSDLKSIRLIGPLSEHYSVRKHKLSGNTGSITTKRKRYESNPAFVDYFLKNGNLDNQMNLTWLYSYKLKFYIMLGKNNDVIESPGTEWSSYVRPQSPRLSYSAKSEIKSIEQGDANILTFVKFAFSRSYDKKNMQSQFQTDDELGNQKLYFRIQLERLVDKDLSNALRPLDCEDVNNPENLKQYPRITVGKALVVEASELTKTNVGIIDNSVRRTTRSLSQGGVDFFMYKVSVEEFMWTGDGQREILIRKPDAELYTCAKLPKIPRGNKETEYTQVNVNIFNLNVKEAD